MLEPQQVVTSVSATVPGLKAGTADQIAGDGVIRLVAEQLSVGKKAGDWVETVHDTVRRTEVDVEDTVAKAPIVLPRK